MRHTLLSHNNKSTNDGAGKNPRKPVAIAHASNSNVTACELLLLGFPLLEAYDLQADLCLLHEYTAGHD